MKLLQYGAGNIGRSLLGYLFSRAGWEVVFVDVDTRVVEALNAQRRYQIVLKDFPPQEWVVQGVRGVHGQDTEAVAEEIACADLAGTAVGARALTHVYPVIAEGLRRREQRHKGPLDLLICENLPDAACTVRRGLGAYVGQAFPLDDMAGLVTATHGKMVPIMPEQIRARDPLLVYAEAHSTLYVERGAFKNPIPELPDLVPVDNIKAYVDRKLFIHNLAHALSAYVGQVVDPRMIYVSDALRQRDVRRVVEGAVWESAQALVKQYPAEFTLPSQQRHVSELLPRIANRELGDTLFRLGRDVSRKLSPGERLVGVLRLQMAHEIASDCTCLGIAAAMRFRGQDESGRAVPEDEVFSQQLRSLGPETILRSACGLDARQAEDTPVVERILGFYQDMGRRKAAAVADFCRSLGPRTVQF